VKPPVGSTDPGRGDAKRVAAKPSVTKPSVTKPSVTKPSAAKPSATKLSATKRAAVRRAASPGTAALQARLAAGDEKATPKSRVWAGAREIWGDVRAGGGKLLAKVMTTVGDADPAPPRPIRPSEVGIDRVLVGAVLLLAAFGMVMVFSSGAVFAAKRYGDSAYFLKREIVYAIIGLGAMSVAARVDYSLYRRLAYPLLFGSILLLAAVLKLGSRAGGAIRWFRAGPLSFQPSELAKFALCVYLAYLLARKAEKVRMFSVGFLPPLLVTGVMMALLLKQPDLGTAAIFGAVALGLLFVAGTRANYLILAVLVAVPAGWTFIVSTPFRMKRMLAFLDPWAFRRDVGYQITESLISVGSGGVTGLGLGDGRQKLFFLPEAHTDFILSIVGEETGLLGVLFVIVTFGVLVWRGLRTALRARDMFGAYLAFGITMMFGLQALVNIGVVLGSLPTKGLPLPFISYGGTSLIMSLASAGVLANISARNPEPGEWLLPGVHKRWLKGMNKRLDEGPRVVVEVGPPPATAGPRSSQSTLSDG
jgi:cell division protein FtsW